jgi:hypothetical protein
MSYFARRIRYAGAETGFVALIELAKKKGGKPTDYFVYKGFIYGKNMAFQMFNCKTNIREDAGKFFPYGYGFWNNEKGWVNTTDWLYEVGVGGGYGIHKQGIWVKVRHPRFRKKKKKKLILKFGLLEHILLIEKGRLKELEDKRFSLVSEEESLMPHDNEGNILGIEKADAKNLQRLIKIDEEIEVLESEIEQQEVRIDRIKSEIRFKHTRVKIVD